MLNRPVGALNDKVIITKVLENKRITSEDHFQDTRHIVLDLPDELGVRYDPGDVVMVQPRNDPVVIAELIKRYGLKPEQRLVITFDESQTSQVSVSSLIKFPTKE